MKLSDEIFYGKLRGRNRKVAEQKIKDAGCDVGRIICLDNNPRTHRKANNNEIPSTFIVETLKKGELK